MGNSVPSNLVSAAKTKMLTLLSPATLRIVPLDGTPNNGPTINEEKGETDNGVSQPLNFTYESEISTSLKSSKDINQSINQSL